MKKPKTKLLENAMFILDLFKTIFINIIDIINV